MKRSRFSEEQIIAVLKEHEAGVAVGDPPPLAAVLTASPRSLARA